MIYAFERLTSSPDSLCNDSCVFAAGVVYTMVLLTFAISVEVVCDVMISLGIATPLAYSCNDIALVAVAADEPVPP